MTQFLYCFWFYVKRRSDIHYNSDINLMVTFNSFVMQTTWGGILLWLVWQSFPFKTNLWDSWLIFNYLLTDFIMANFCWKQLETVTIDITDFTNTPSQAQRSLGWCLLVLIMWLMSLWRNNSPYYENYDADVLMGLILWKLILVGFNWAYKYTS